MEKIKTTDKGNCFLVRVTDNDKNNTTAQLAVVNIDDNFKVKLFKIREEFIRIKKENEDGRLYDVRFFSELPDYISECDYAGAVNNDDEIMEIFEEVEMGDEGVARIELPEMENVATLITDCGLVQVYDDTFMFTTYIKHTNTILETNRIPFDMLK
jgi:hypothetical protein